MRHALVLLVGCTSLAVGQRGPVSSARFTIETVSQERWLNARQQAQFAPTTAITTWIVVDSIHADSATRTFWTKTGSESFGDPATVVVSLDGRVRSIDAFLRPRPDLSGYYSFFHDTSRTTRLRVVDFRSGRLDLPGARVWDMIPAFHPARLVAGAQWTDTIRNVATMGIMHESMSGVRTSTIAGDTVVDNRHFWIVHDSANVRYNELAIIDERQMDTMVTVTRTVAGVIRGRYLYDPDNALFRSRHDTTLLSGSAVLRYPDGRQFTSSTRFDRSRTWMVYDSAQYARRSAELDSALRANFPSGVGMGAPRPLQQRSAAERISAGDTAFIFDRAIGGGGADRVTLPDLQFVLPFLQDPGLAFQFGLSRDLGYEGIAYALVVHPPFERDTAQWGCEPAACALLASLWKVGTEPRLKNVALIALAFMDPARWADTIRKHIASGEYPLADARAIVNGLGNSAPMATPMPIPAQGADWRAWRDWLGVTRPDAPPPDPRLPEPPPPWVTSSGNAFGIRFRQAETGRDIVGELKREYGQATLDTARFVYGRVLRTLGELDVSADSLAAFLTHGPPLMRALARELMDHGWGGSSYQPADSALTDSLQSHLLQSMLAQKRAWKTVEEIEGSATEQFRNPPSDASVVLPMYVSTTTLSVALANTLAANVRLVSDAAWRGMDHRMASERWELTRAQRNGAFVRISLVVSGRLGRTALEAPAQWASFTTYTLMAFHGEWVIVAETFGVT